jgi:hypothetical protein
MSTTEIRDASTNNYIVLTQYDSSNNLEIAVAQSLVQSAYQKVTINTSTGIYTSPANDSSWNCVSINDTNPAYINTSAISNYPSGTLTEYSVISSRLTQDISLNSYSTNICNIADSNNLYNFQTLNTTAGIYDANYVITQNLIADCSDNQTGNYVTATFDVDASNAKIQYAMQSRWNTTLGPYDGLTTVGPDPTAIQQKTNTNVNYAFAKYGTGATDSSYNSYWLAVGSIGDPIGTLIDASYQPVNNNLLVGDRDLSGVTLDIDDVGIFRIQQPSNIVTTKVTRNGTTYLIEQADLDNMPLFNGYGVNTLVYDSSKNSLLIPGTMSDVQFQSLINAAVYDTVADDWTFTIDISSNNGGYDISGNHPLTTDLDNSNLLDNPFYMENYVSNDHTINFSNLTIAIDVSTNGTTSDASSITIDLTDGETLYNLYAGQDGQIIINTNRINTRYTDLRSVDLTGSFYPTVYYPTDTGRQSLTDEEMINPYLEGMWQKVAQQSSTTNSDYYLKTDNNAIMTLYTEPSGIVDNSYNATDFDFSFNNTLFTNNDIQLWKIVGSNNVIVNPYSFYTDASYTTVVDGFSTAGVLTGLTDDLTYNSYRVLLTAKDKSALSLQTAVNNVTNWRLEYLTGNRLQSSSDRAYSQSAIPSKSYNQKIMNFLNSNSDNTITYTYKYYTVQDSSGIGGLVDYVDITYDYLGQNIITTIHQTSITRVYTSTDVSYVIVDPSSYTFTNTFFNKISWELVYVRADSKYNANFPASFGPFSNIQLRVLNIAQTDVYYAIRNKNNGQFSPHSALQFVSAPDIPDLTTINETILPPFDGSLTINGTLTSNDIKPFMSITQGEDTSGNWINIGSSIDTDVYYGLINDENVISGKLLTRIEYSQITTANIALVEENYYIPFVYDQSANVFALQSYSASTSTIGTAIGSPSFLNNKSYLSLTDGYNSVGSNWSNTPYTISIGHTTDSTTFTVKNSSDTTVFTITALNNTIFLGTYFVSYIPDDYYRVERLLGNSVVDSSYNESFLTVNNYNVGQVNLAPTLQGMYIGAATNLSPNLGGYQSFRIIGDYMSINPVGLATIPTYANELGISSYNYGSLTYQYIDTLDSSSYSANFIFPRYRGYKSYSDTNPDEYYTINRNPTVVTFNVSGSGSLSSLSEILSSNMYYNESFGINNLQNTSNQLVANLNLTGSFNYSIPPSGSSLTYPITVTGDTVNVSINNPNYLGSATNIPVDASATPVVDPNLYNDSMTLKDYGTNDEYTFSGLWYSTNNLMAIRPSRVKLLNTSYPYDTFSYEIKLLGKQITLYKALNVSSDVSFNWLGNPALNGTQDPDLDPSSNDWRLVGTYPVSSIYRTNGVGGINIGKKVVYQNPNLSIGFKLAYMTSMPTYYTFDQISTNSSPEIPYNYNSDYLGDRTVRYMPFIDTTTGALKNVFNPFQPVVSYVDINGNVTNILSNSDILNNIRFTLTSPDTMASATSAVSADNTRYGIIVPGTNLTVNEYVGFYPGTNSGSHVNPIWSGPVTSIPSTPNIDNNALILRNRDMSGGVYFSALQYPVDIGYPSGTFGYEEVFKTDISSNWYNVNFNIGNTSWFNNNDPVTYFDVNAHGIMPTLYTVEDISNPLTQRNKRRVYKYTSNSTIDIDLSNSSISELQTFNLTFENRSYYDFDISMNNSFPSSPNDCWKYNDLLNSTIIPNTQINWIVDTSYSEISYVSFAFGNSTTSTKLLIELFSVQDNQSKWCYLNLKPFMRYLNQFNMQVGSIAWDGSVTAPLVNTRVLALSPALQTPILTNNTYSIQEYSESTY